jgi:osmotically-inducible protein OsmY
MAEQADHEIEQRIREAMADEEHLGSLDIQLEVTDGIARLRGTVDSAMQRSLVEEAARLAGAREVVNELEISGEPIAGAARRRRPEGS